MVGWEFIVDDEADRGGIFEVVDVPLRVEGVGDVALLGEDENWVVEVGAEGYPVHVKEVMACFVGAESDG